MRTLGLLYTNLAKSYNLIFVFLIISIAFILYKFPPITVLFLLIALVISLLFFDNPLKALSIFIFMIPFSKLSFMSKALLGIKGTEPLYLLAFFVIIIALLNYHKAEKMPPFAFYLYLTLFLIFTYVMIRALPNMDAINERFVIEGRAKLSTFPFILKIYVRPLIYSLPFIIILKFCRTKENLFFLIKILIISTSILAFALLFVFTFKISDKGNIGYVSSFYESFFGLNRNDIANFFIAAFPFLLGNYFLRKNSLNLIALGLNVVAIGFLYSRTAYGILLLTFIMYLIISKRAKFMPIFLLAAFGVSIIISASILERATKGFDSGDLNNISAGRTGNLWEPLLMEYISDPHKLILGNGRYSIVSSKSVKLGYTPDSMMHPHNMFLEQIFDGGLISFFIIGSLLLVLLKKSFKNLKRNENLRIKEIQYAAIIAFLAYLIAGLTGRTLFPSSKSSYFWIVVAINLVLIYLPKNSNSEVPALKS